MTIQGFGEGESPPTNHLLQAKNKFNLLYEEMKTGNADFEEGLLLAKERTVELVEHEKILKQRVEDALSLGSKSKQQADATIAEMKAKLNAAVKAREEILDKEERLRDQFADMNRENERLTRVINDKLLEDTIDQELFASEVARLKEDIAAKESIYNELKEKRAENLEILNKDFYLKELKEKNATFVEKISVKEKELHDINYKCFELENLQKLAVKQKEIDGEEKRQFLEELDRLENLVSEAEKMNDLKIQRKIRENDSPQLRQIENEMVKEQRELAELKEKWNNVHTVYRKRRLETATQKEMLDKMRALNVEKRQKCDKLTEKMDLTLPETDAIVKKKEILEETNIELKKNWQEKRNEVERLELEFVGLRSKLDFLSKNFDFNELLGQLNLEDLKQQVTSNISVNETIHNVLQNWDNMKKFGRS